MSRDSLEPRFFAAADGAELAWYEIGAGRPLVLIHGLFSNAWTNWVRYGHAERLASEGRRVIMPDLRGHGRSAAPRDPAAYPPDILATDALALIAHLGIEDYDLGGYSLGARTTLRALVRGARPRRAFGAGMGLDGILDTQGRGAFFRGVLEKRGTHPRGSTEWMSEAFLKTTGGDAEALLLILDTFIDTEIDALRALTMPIGIICGVDDHDNGSAEALANIFPQGWFEGIPGNHMSAVLRPELGQAIAAFLVQ
ncbi:alpha/beta fold hydrolase [Sphingomonas bacterium]|uniref:alpha/beta fold hydrolase n=1 Tax=Sphingomonas bacterium TaxID=1895847 RepID=UPI00157705BA|nr:alpha/beta fold hydrolase [Sphingomonas bacterium]